MASLDGTPTQSPEEDPEITAYQLLAQATDSSTPSEIRKILTGSAQAYATLALVREQKRTNRLLTSRRNPPTLNPKEK